MVDIVRPIRRRVQAKVDPVGMTEQSHANDVDINKIMARYHKTGLLQTTRKQALVGDFSSVGSYQECLEKVLAAQDAFMSLDSQIRARFDNDVSKIIDFCENPENLEEAIKLGLVDKPDVESSVADLEKVKEPVTPEDVVAGDPNSLST